MIYVFTGYKSSRNKGDDKGHYSWITQRESSSTYRYQEKAINQQTSSFTYWYHEEPNRKRELVSRFERYKNADDFQCNCLSLLSDILDIIAIEIFHQRYNHEKADITMRSSISSLFSVFFILPDIQLKKSNLENGGSLTLQCVGMVKGWMFQWVNFYCYLRNSYICEIRLDSVTENPTSVSK